MITTSQYSQSGTTYLGTIGLVAWEWTQSCSTLSLNSKVSQSEIKHVSLKLSVQIVRSNSNASLMLSPEMIDTLFREVLPQKNEVPYMRALPAGH
jgi:hypothetical protein